MRAMSLHHGTLYCYCVFFIITLFSSLCTLQIKSASATLIRVVIENCFDDVDAEEMSNWLVIRGHPDSTVTPCGDLSAVLAAISERSNVTLTVHAMVSFELAAMLQLAAPGQQLTTTVLYTRSDHWHERGDGPRPRCGVSSTRSVDFRYSGGGVYRLLNSTNLSPMIRRRIKSDDSCGIATWKDHLLSLMRHVNVSEMALFESTGSTTSALIYLYNDDGRSTMSNSGPRSRHSRSIKYGRSGSPIFDTSRNDDLMQNGTWPTRGVNEPLGVRRDFYPKSVSKRFFRIGIIKFPPFLVVTRKGTDEIYSGIAIDIIGVLASKLDFNYTLKVIKGYGSKLPNGTWGGAIGAVINNEVDMVVADISMSPERVEVVDFSVPYMQGSQGVVIRRAMEQPSVGDLLRTHLRPFHWSIWLVVFAALLLSTALLTYSSTSTPDDRQESCVVPVPLVPPHGVRPFLATQPPAIVSQRARHRPAPTLSTSSPSGDQEMNETWWSIMFQMLGIFCQQGCALSPNRTSGRVILYTVCLTSLATYNFYTSVFISFTTVTKKPVPVNTLSDVLSDPTYEFGFFYTSVVEEMFQTSNKLEYRRAWRRMQQQPEKVYVSSVAEGINRSYVHKYAFIDEMYSLQWHVARNCSLKVLQERLLNEGYHIILTKNSNDTQVFNQYLKRLQESGMIGRFLSSHMPPVTDDFCADVNTLEAVGLDRMAGLFMCLALGVALATISVILEKLDRPMTKGDGSKGGTTAALTTNTIKIITIKIKNF